LNHHRFGNQQVRLGYSLAMVTRKPARLRHRSVIIGIAVASTMFTPPAADAASKKKTTTAAPPPALDGRCSAAQVGKIAIVNGRKLQCVKKPWVVPLWKPVAGPAGKAPKGTTFPDTYVGTITMASRPDSGFTFNATGTIRLERDPREFSPRFASYRLTELTYDYTFTGTNDQGVQQTCNGTLKHELAGDSKGLEVILKSTQVNPPNYYSLAIRGNVRVCDGAIIGRLAWPDDLDVTITDRTYTYTMDLTGSLSSPSNGLPWTWSLKPV
jgi:hypothetical protein